MNFDERNLWKMCVCICVLSQERVMRMLSWKLPRKKSVTHSFTLLKWKRGEKEFTVTLQVNFFLINLPPLWGEEIKKHKEEPSLAHLLVSQWHWHQSHAAASVTYGCLKMLRMSKSNSREEGRERERAEMSGQVIYERCSFFLNPLSERLGPEVYRRWAASKTRDT